MKRRSLAEIPVPLIAAALAASYVWQTWGYPQDAILFPYAVALLMLGFGAFILVTHGRSHDRPEDEPQGEAGRVGRARSILMVAATLAYVWAMNRLGFFVVTSVFLAGTMWLLGNARPWLYVPIAVLAAAGVTLALDRLLNITVPTFPYAALPLGL